MIKLIGFLIVTYLVCMVALSVIEYITELITRKR
jgi:hypothetical protein